MKKMTKKEKILLGVSIVGACAAGYFGYKYVSNNNKIKLLEKNLELTTNELDVVFQDNKDNCEKLKFLEFLVIESECVPKALQNANNKLSRVQSKIAIATERLLKAPDDGQTQKWLENNKAEETKLIEHIAKAMKLDEMVKTDQNIYAK